MIFEALAGFWFALLSFVVGLLPVGDAPSWVTDMGATLSSLLGYASGLGAWFPFELAGTVLAAVLLSIGVGFAIKVARIVASFLTVGGGSAG